MTKEIKNENFKSKKEKKKELKTFPALQ